MAASIKMLIQTHITSYNTFCGQCLRIFNFHGVVIFFEVLETCYKQDFKSITTLQQHVW